MRVGSAYDTGLVDGSVDVIFCISLIHHLEIARVRQEMLRLLAKGGRVILKEPIRFSTGYDRLRKMLPARGDISDYEHPLTRPEFAEMCAPFAATGMRYFRLPMVPLLHRISPRRLLWGVDRWLLQHVPPVNRYATSVAVCLRKPA